MEEANVMGLNFVLTTEICNRSSVFTIRPSVLTNPKCTETELLKNALHIAGIWKQRIILLLLVWAEKSLITKLFENNGHYIAFGSDFSPACCKQNTTFDTFSERKRLFYRVQILTLESNILR